jgi:competence protein ComEA
MKSLRWLVLMLAAVCLTVGPMAQSGYAADKKVKTAAAKPADDSKLVDINSASAADLDALPGIGKTRGAAIIKGRPYANKTQLVSKGILTQPVYDKIANKIVAKQK